MEQSFLLEGANLVVVSILVLALGRWLNQKVSLLSRFNIPIAVSGGLSCSVLVTVLYLVCGGWALVRHRLRWRICKL